MKTTNMLAATAAVAMALWGSTGLSDKETGGHGTHGVASSTRLVQQVQDATRRFRDVSVALAEGYAPFLGCVSGPQEGAMGIHYVNGALVGDPLLDPAQPEILIYEPYGNGELRFVGVEFLVLHEAWHASNELPPALAGQVFHFSGSPNRYGLPPFYELHVWAWRENPHGTFVDWNPRVSCDGYSPDS